MKKLTFKDYVLQPEKYNLLDVRTHLERNNFHIGGIHIPLNELPNRLSEIPTNKPILVYCNTGLRSARAIEYLKTKNLKVNIIKLKNGLSESTLI